MSEIQPAPCQTCGAPVKERRISVTEGSLTEISTTESTARVVKSLGVV